MAQRPTEINNHREAHSSRAFIMPVIELASLFQAALRELLNASSHRDYSGDESSDFLQLTLEQRELFLHRGAELNGDPGRYVQVGI
jgi:hypothetical protein